MTIDEDTASEPGSAPGFADASSGNDDAPEWACDGAICPELRSSDAHAEHPGYEAAFSHPECRNSAHGDALQALAESGA